MRSVQWLKFSKKYLYLGVLSLFYVLIFTNLARAIWVDADGSGKESVNISTNTGTSESPSLYLDSSRNAHIAWYDTTSGNEEIYYLKWDGTAWVDANGSGQGSINISNTIGGSYQPSLRLDGSGKPHIAWKDYTPGNFDIYYLKWSGTEWVDVKGSSGKEVINVSNTSTDSYHASLRLDGLGRPHVAWFENTSGNNDIYYLKWDGTEWVDVKGSSGKEAVNVSTNTGSSENPSLYLDSSGNPHIAWHDDTSGDEEVYYLKWNDTEWVDVKGSSGKEVINVSNRPGDSGNVSLYLDSSGNPHIAWYDFASGKNDIYYLKWNGTAWVDVNGSSGQESINISDKSGISNYPSLYLDNYDNPHIAWHNSLSGTSGPNDIYYLKWNGTAWVDGDGSGQESINISANDGDSSYPSLYLDSSDNPHIAWKDKTPGVYDIYYLKWNDAPALSWTGEANYTNDGLHPETGYRDADFVYRVKYTDMNNDGPKSGYPKVHIMKGGIEIAGSPFTMSEVDAGDTDYSDGKLYTYTKSGLAPVGEDYTYYFEAKDVWNTLATGAPTSAEDGPDVINRAPALSWTGEANYIDDGLNPETGDRGTNFVYRVNYTDGDNDGPAAGYPKVHIMKGGIEIAGSPFAMNEVNPGDTDYSDGKLYTYNQSGLVEPGEDYTYYFEAEDVWNGSATGDPTSPVDGPDVENIVPTLSWTGETNYTDDGLNPETGYQDTNFVYRVEYTDEDNDGLASGYPKLHIMKDGMPISGSPFAMSEVNSGDTNYSDGKLYTYTKSGLEPGDDYTYYFEAKDVFDAWATGDPTTSQDGPDVTNRAPTLSWTGETNYTNDGLNPETGYPNTDFVYRVKYTDVDNDGPASGYPKLHIMKDGKPISGSPFAMSEIDTGDTNYSDGKLYTYTKSGLAPGEDYTYYFEAKDVWDGAATGDPTTSQDGPDVTNRAPTLSWTGETNYTNDGLNPETGYPNTDFVYRVKYTDMDNDGPASGYPKLHIMKGGIEISGSPFAMSEVNSGDTNYSDGKLYTYTKSRLGPGEDYTYYFEAKDVWNDSATGVPTSAQDGPDVTNRAPTLSWTGETYYTDDGLDPEDGHPGTNFVYRVKYADEDNDPPASGYPKLHIMKDGKPISGSPFAISEVDSGDTNYSDGKLYTYTKSGLAPGEDYTYYFEAEDVWNSSATGKPTSLRDGPVVNSSPPVLKVDPSSLDFGLVVKGKTEVKTLTISNLGPGTLRGTITTDKAWISVAPTSFRNNYLTVSVTVDTDMLEVWKKYTGKITVDSNGGVETVNVSITPVTFLVKGGVKIQGGENGYVNPLKGEVAKIHFEPSESGTVNVKIFTLIGLLVWEKSKDVSPVQDFIEWDCRNTENDVVASGIYLVYVQGPGIKATKKVAVLK